MGSGGGGGYFGGDREVADLRSESLENLRDAEAEAEIAGYLVGLLGRINDRDIDATKAHLDELLITLRDQVDDAVDLRFGGSVAKHTYVDGLSDVDVLVLLSERGAGAGPREVLDQFVQAIRNSGIDVLSVTSGRIAVTVEYQDGTVVQLLPAVRAGDHYAIADSSGTGWSEIRPKRFAEKLSQVNSSNGGRLVPLIKLVKSAVVGLPEDRRPSGYHLESLAIEAFENYSGPRALRPMLSHFFRRASELVLAPIRDSTGQSVHVDEHLGPEGSLARRLVSDSLGRLSRRVDSARSADQLQQIVDPS